MLLLLSHFSCVQLFVTPWTAAHQPPPSMGFSRQEYWSGGIKANSSKKSSCENKSSLTSLIEIVSNLI